MGSDVDGVLVGEKGRSEGVRGVRRRVSAGAAIATVLCLAAAGCGSSGTKSSGTSGGSSTTTASSSGGSQSTGSGSGTISASTLATLQKAVTSAEAVPAFTAPGPSASASVVKGKSVLVMPVNSEIGACQTQTNDFSALAKKLGMSVTVYNDAGNPAQWEQGVEEATSEKDSAIALICGIVPQAIGPQLTEAEKGGAVVVDGNYNEVTDYTDLDGETAVDVIGGMDADVDDALVNLKGKPLHALVVSTDSIVQGPAAQAAVSQQIAKVCPSSCSVEAKVIVPIQNWSTAVQSDVNTALVAHPDINAVFINFDGMTQFALPAVEQAKRSGLKIYTWGASNTVEEQLTSDGDYLAADPGPDEQWDAYEAMDQIIRLLGHHSAASVSKEVDPNRFWVPSNVAAFFGPDHSYGNGGYGGEAFIKGFDTLWGTSTSS